MTRHYTVTITRWATYRLIDVEARSPEEAKELALDVDEYDREVLNEGVQTVWVEEQEE